MMHIQSLEARAFIASRDDDIDALVTQFIEAQNALITAKGTYLKVLLATTQAELHLKPRKVRARRLEALPAPDVPVHVMALESVHKRFYVKLLAGYKAKGLLPAEVNKKTSFARSYKSVVRTWIRSGRNIGSLAAGTITRDALLLQPKRSKGARMPKLLRSIDRRVRALAIDRKTRVETAQALTTLASSLLIEAGVRGERNTSRAFQRRSPLVTSAGTFLPVMRLESREAVTSQ